MPIVQTKLELSKHMYTCMYTVLSLIHFSCCSCPPSLSLLPLPFAQTSPPQALFCSGYTTHILEVIKFTHTHFIHISLPLPQPLLHPFPLPLLQYLPHPLPLRLYFYWLYNSHTRELSLLFTHTFHSYPSSPASTSAHPLPLPLLKHIHTLISFISLFSFPNLCFIVFLSPYCNFCPILSPSGFILGWLHNSYTRVQ